MSEALTPEKRRKIQALLDCPASTENEKAICRKLLAEGELTERQKNYILRFMGTFTVKVTGTSVVYWSATTS